MRHNHPFRYALLAMLLLTIALAMPALAASTRSGTSAPVASTGVVISEFRTRGPLGGNDEFVELYNLANSSEPPISAPADTPTDTPTPTPTDTPTMTPTPQGGIYGPVRHVVAGGGGMFSTGGDFRVGGTIGQHDAGSMAGGDFVVNGGFWAGVGVPATPTATATPTETATETATDTPSATPTDTPTETPTDTPTDTPTQTPTDTPTQTPTSTPTPSNTATSTPTNTRTNTPTNTSTTTPTGTRTSTPTATPTATQVATLTATRTATITPQPTGTSTATTTQTVTGTPTGTLTRTSTATATTTATQTAVSTSTSTATQTPTNTPSALGVIVGHVTWQGIGQPNARNSGITATLSLCVGGVTQSYNVATDASGFFTATTGLPDGSYNWRVKGSLNLANSGALTIAAGVSNQEMGTQRSGDCNNSNNVNATDFTLLKNTFGKSNGQPGYDARGDLNRDQVVNSADFNLLKGNFGQAGATLTCP